MVIGLGYGLIFLKSQTTVFGGHFPPHFFVKLNEAPVPYVDTVKYLGVFINSRTNRASAYGTPLDGATVKVVITTVNKT